MSRNPIPTWCVALAVVHDRGRFLLIQELDGSWFFPAGLMARGETWPEAVQRIAWEEAGARIILQGIYKMEHMPVQDGARFRVMFVAQPLTDAPVKSIADEHSKCARWFTLRELTEIQVRNIEVLRTLVDIAKGAPITSLDILQIEGKQMAMA